MLTTSVCSSLYIARMTQSHFVTGSVRGMNYSASDNKHGHDSLCALIPSHAAALRRILDAATPLRRPDHRYDGADVDARGCLEDFLRAHQSQASASYSLELSSPRGHRLWAGYIFWIVISDGNLYHMYIFNLERCILWISSVGWLSISYG